MRYLMIFCLCAMTACMKEGKAPAAKQIEKPVTNEPTIPQAKIYSNERFHEVAVKMLAAGKYQVTGKAQVFEAAFSWVVEDGHNELASGHEMTDAGAPAWG